MTPARIALTIATLLACPTVAWLLRTTLPTTGTVR